MVNALATLWGIAIAAFLMAFMDWLGRRRDRSKREAAAETPKAG
jgi:hypothetical protein